MVDDLLGVPTDNPADEHEEAIDGALKFKLDGLQEAVDGSFKKLIYLNSKTYIILFNHPFC